MSRFDGVGNLAQDSGLQGVGESGDATGPDAAADVQANVNQSGRLQLLWRTNGNWAGSCRSLVVRLGFAGWTGVDAIFTVRFS